MFMGEYTHGVDEKGRFIMPSKFREKLGKEFVITRGVECCLHIYTKEEWDALVMKLEALPGNKKSTRDLKRYLLGGAVECEIDKQGRCLIAPKLRAFAKIGPEVKIVGIGSTLEIWDSGVWEEYNSQDDLDLEEMAESLGLDIPM